MTDDEARRLATRIIDTWPTGAKAYIWRDNLISLDHALTQHAIRTLEREVTRGAPTIGQLHAAYHAHQRALNPPTTEPAHTNTQAISLTEYTRRLTDRANRGDTEAIDELGHWARYLEHNRTRP